MASEETLQALRDEIAEITIERDSLSLELSDIRKENEDLRNRLQSAVATQVHNDFFDDLRQQLDDLSNENGLLSSQVRKLREELSLVKSENSNLATENSTLQSRISDLSSSLSAYTSISPDPSSLASDLSLRLSPADSAALRAAASAAAAKQTELESANARLSLQLHEVQLMLANQDRASEEYAQSQSEVRLWRSRMEEVLRQNGSLIAQLQASQSRCEEAAQLELRNIELAGALEGSSASLRMKDGQLAELRGSLAEAEQKGALFAAKLAIVAEENRQLNAVNEELVGTIGRQLDLEEMEGDARAVAEARVKLLEELNAELQRALTGSEEQGERAARLEIQLERVQQENAELCELCELSAQQIASVQNAVSGVHETLSQISTEKEALEREGEAFKSVIQEMEQENEALRKKVDTLEEMDADPFVDDTVEIVRENRELHDQLHALKRDMASVVSYRSRIDSLTREVDALKARVSDAPEAIVVECAGDDEDARDAPAEDAVECDPDFVDISETDPSTTAEARQNTQLLSRLLTDELANTARLAGRLEEADREKGELAGRVDALSFEVGQLHQQIEVLRRENDEQRSRLERFEADGNLCANHLTELNRILALHDQP